MHDPRAILEAALLSDNGLDATYVFPSEVVRAHWAERYLAISGKTAARSDRFIAWDRFRDLFLLNAPGGRAVDDLDRLLYAADLLARNAVAASEGSPLLFDRPRPEFAQAPGAFLQAIKAVLPALGRIERVEGDDTRLRDLRFIEADYREFLERQGLYEKAWLKPEWRGEGQFVLYLCDLATDWRDMRSALAGIDWVRIIETPKGAKRPPLRLFESEAEEIAYTVGEIADALRSGIDHRDIAVSLGGSDRMLPRLQREARLKGVELDIREGMPLSSYPAGRFFRSYARCAAGAMKLDDLKELLAPGLYPWRRARDLEGLVRFGAEHKILLNFNESGGVRIDAWEDALNRLGAGSGIASVYRELRRDFAAFKACDSLQKLRSFFSKVLSERMDRVSWDAEADAVIARCAMELDALARRETELGLAIRDPASVFLTRLDASRYLPDRPDRGVPVYRYRVSAGINPKLHLALGLSLERATVRSSPEAAFLDEVTRSLMGIEIEDMSARYAWAYAVSGEELRASASSSSSEGRSMAHPAYEAFQAESGAADLAADPLAAEAAFFQGAGAVDSTSQAIRASALAYATRIERGLDLRYSALPRESIATAPSEERASVSPTGLDVFTSCPFLWFLSRCLKLRPKEDHTDLTPPDKEGLFLHAAVAGALRAYRDAGRTFGAVPRDEAARIIEEAVDAVLSGELTKQGAVAAAAWGARRGFAVDALLRLWDWLVKDSAERVPMAVEAELSSGSDPELRGRIDAVLGGAGSTMVIDFKRSEPPSIASHRVGMGGRVESSQMAVYAILAREAGLGADECAYWSFVKGEPKRVLGGGGKALSADEFEASIEAVLAQAREMVSKIEGGDYRIAEAPPCLRGACDMAPVCRRPYLSEDRRAAP